MTRCLPIITLVLLCAASSASADTISAKRPSDAKANLVASDVYVTEAGKDTAGAIDKVTYYYRNPRQRTLNRAEVRPASGQVLNVEYSSAESRPALLSRLLVAAIRAEIRDMKGGVHEVFGPVVGYYPPRGYYGCCGDDEAVIRVRTKTGIKDLRFYDLRSAEFIAAEEVEIITNKGVTLRGEWIKPYSCSRLQLEGLSRNGEPSSIELSDVIKITFGAEKP